MLKISRRAILKFGAIGSVAAATRMPASPALAASDPIHFAVGPFLPTPDDTKKEWEPMFMQLSKAIGRPYTLVATSDWAGISIALGSGRADVAFVGPLGYELAKREGHVVPLAVSLVNGSATYRSIIVARKGLTISKFPEDAKGLRMSFADVGSTSGWLVPSYWFKSQGIDPKTYFKYRDGNTHAANEVAVAAGQVDLATDNDRNRLIMIQRGVIKAEDTTPVWTSEPIPNSLMAARGDLDPGLLKATKNALLAIAPEAAKASMPKNFTGWADTTDADYALIEKAGIALGALKAV
ncbi:MAG TPA: phosphate/phosphite/phosphonate ABC transporter substrate-binding protein [Bradyrhizobium sp.]|nr:phosphate/phosphite/phosphonate ABC transporter substrate-binding protein [Bradyrhizobium sp.]